MKKRKEVILKEILPTDPIIIRDTNQNSYNGEFILPFFKKRHLPLEDDLHRTNSDSTKRVFHIGSEWLFLKIYINEGLADKFILDVYNSVIQPFKDDVNKWYYIKYLDDGEQFHLRLRLKLSDKSAIPNIINSITEFANNKSYLIHNLKIESYKREVERYGATTIENAENIFNYDSETVIKLLSIQTGDPEERLVAIMQIVEAYFSASGWTEAQRLEYLSSETKKFVLFHSNKPLRIRLNFEYRAKRDRFNAARLKVQEHIKILEARLTYELSFFDLSNHNLIRDFIHMSLNRSIARDTALHEYIVYYLLMKSYAQQVALRKSQSINSV